MNASTRRITEECTARRLDRPRAVWERAILGESPTEDAAVQTIWLALRAPVQGERLTIDFPTIDTTITAYDLADAAAYSLAASAAAMLPLRSAVVAWDNAEEADCFQAYVRDDNRWNGFHCPLFTLEEATRLAEVTQRAAAEIAATGSLAETDVLTLNPDGRTFTHHRPQWEDSQIEPTHDDTLDLDLYGIGGWEWTWMEIGPDEEEEEEARPLAVADADAVVTPSGYRSPRQIAVEGFATGGYVVDLDDWEAERADLEAFGYTISDDVVSVGSVALGYVATRWTPWNICIEAVVISLVPTR